jgi:aconitase A
MADAKDSWDSLVDEIDSPKGTARFYSLSKLKERGHDTTGLPYSIRILLENAVRISAEGSRSTEEVDRLLRWPESIGSGFAFMPYRVLLQDYTGVPLIVDLAAMRDAMKRSGADPRTVNSQVPMDLIIDHSVQVDGWGDSLAFNFNIEKEYERNSERYALLKWAQGSFKGLRVFPPGKGICHQVNLEYLSTVVALKEGSSGLVAVPDTLIGTDSHTTMVNGLGVLGWGAGGIEAEAVMLGQPYHMPIPRVVGVKIVGQLREGTTPTDVVLRVTELLRSRNVVDAFVEYFGEGYGHLSVPDRATLGNMSPEYGATAGYSPVDQSTIQYLLDTGRDPDYVRFVEEYCRRQGLFVTPESPEPHYSEVLVINLDEIEPSIAGPRNPEERRSLTTVPSFAKALIEEKRKARPPSVTTSASSGGQTLVQTGGFGHDPEGLDDGSVIIAAITSCTNTSNPTVMLGAGLIAKKAVERGLSPKRFVKGSLAPGSTVVKDYLEGSDLLRYLDKIGFNLVGYGCTSCISQGTPILLSNGTTRPIESMRSTDVTTVMAPRSTGRLAIAQQSAFLSNGIRDCIELVLQDGRTLICTPDHLILTSEGRWVRADELEIARDRVVAGLEGPLDVPGLDERGYALKAGSLSFNMETEHDRARSLAFARLIGYLCGDGSISTHGQGRICMGQALDREMALNDIELLTGLRPSANRYDERKWSVILPTPVTTSIISLSGILVGKRVKQPPALPEFITADGCPVALVREFLGGLFGADGRGPVLKRWGGQEGDSTLDAPAFSQSTIPAYLEQSKVVMQQIVRLLSKCGVRTEGARIYHYATRRSPSSAPMPKDGLPRLEVRLQLPDGLSFVERVGFRYSVDKTMRASAAAVYWRLVRGIHEQRLWMADRLDEIHQNEPTASFSEARDFAATALLNRDGPPTTSLRPVVFPHYALLQGYDRFSRLPKSGDRRFQPLHRDSCDFPSPAQLFGELGVRDWFAARGSKSETNHAKRYCVDKEAIDLPTFSLRVVGRREVGQRMVYDLTIDDLHAFIAGTVAVHNCIGNSGPLDPAIESEIKERDLYTVAVLSGNRNFDGRIHPLAKGAFLMSPMLVVAYALVGRMDFDFAQSMGTDKSGKPVYLKDLWPSLAEIKETASRSLNSGLYRKRYADALTGDAEWLALPGGSGDTFEWDTSSTYVREPPWFEEPASTSRRDDIHDARVLGLYGDKITTDHISPAGSIAIDSPAGEYLIEHGVEMVRFSTYGARRGNHEVMVRGGFANIRLRNLLAGGKEGWYTKYLPTGEVTSVFEASRLYRKTGTPLIILAGKQYGSGSSRDWAAKAPKLLGVKAVIAESFERIHRSNLIAMGIIPLEFPPGKNVASLGLTGEETFSIMGIKDLKPGGSLEVVASSGSREVRFEARVRIDNKTEIEYYDSGGVLPFVFGRVRDEAKRNS